MPNINQNQRSGSEYARWSGLTLRMIAVIVIFTLGGHYADGYFHFQHYYLTISGALLATIAAFAMLIKEAIRK